MRSRTQTRTRKKIASLAGPTSPTSRFYVSIHNLKVSQIIAIITNKGKKLLNIRWKMKES